MNVKELMEVLTTLPPEMEVILQRDPEGNGYSPLAGADPNAVYIEDDREVYSTDWSADDACMEEEEWEEIKSQPHCLVLFPCY